MRSGAYRVAQGIAQGICDRERRSERRAYAIGSAGQSAGHMRSGAQVIAQGIAYRICDRERRAQRRSLHPRSPHPHPTQTAPLGRLTLTLKTLYVKIFSFILCSYIKDLRAHRAVDAEKNLEIRNELA